MCSQENITDMIERYRREMIDTYSYSPSTEEIIAVAEDPVVETDEYVDIGQLQVIVRAENEGIPISGAVITITQSADNGITLIRTMISDDSGETPFIDLLTVDRRYTLSPGYEKPYASYTVDVSADGYFSKRFTDLPIYGGVAAIQQVNMIPLPEQSENDRILTYPQSGPTQL